MPRPVITTGWQVRAVSSSALLILGIYLFQVLCARCYSYEAGSAGGTLLLAVIFASIGIIIFQPARTEHHAEFPQSALDNSHLLTTAALTAMHVVTPVPAEVPNSHFWSACSLYNALPVLMVFIVVDLLRKRGRLSHAVRPYPTQYTAGLLAFFMIYSVFAQSTSSITAAQSRGSSVQANLIPICCQVRPVRTIVDRSAWHRVVPTNAFFCVRESCVVLRNSRHSEVLFVDIKCDRFRRYEVSASYRQLGFPALWSLWSAGPR